MTKVEKYQLKLGAKEIKDLVVNLPQPHKKKPKEEIKLKPSGSENKIHNSETTSSNESIHQCKICNNNF